MSRRTSSPAAVAPSAPPWVWITPLGVPRLPEVNTIARSSAGRTDASSAQRRVRRRRRSCRRAVVLPHGDGAQAGQRLDHEPGARDQLGRDRHEVGDVVTTEELAEHQMLDTRGAQLRCQLGRAEEGGERHDGRAGATGAERDHGPRSAVRHQHADGRALADAEAHEVAGERGAATLELAVRQRVVGGDHERPLGLLLGHRRTRAGTVRRSPLIEELLDRRQIGLATREHRQVGRREHEEATGHLVRRQPRAQLGAQRVEVGRGVGLGQDHRRDHLVALGIGDAQHHRREAAGGVAQRGFDLERRHVRTRGLDHGTAPAVEVEEAVGVNVEHVAGAVPAVGREDLEALTPVVALHERRPAEPQLADGADRRVLEACRDRRHAA